MFKSHLIKTLKRLKVNLRLEKLPNLKKISSRIPKNNFKIDKKILIATSAGGLKAQIVLESLIALGLEYKGSEVEFLFCDEVLPACIMSTYYNTNEKIILEEKKKTTCDICFYSAKKYLEKTNFKINKFSDYISFKEIENISNYLDNKSSLENLKNLEIDKIKVGEHAYSGALRYYAKTKVDDEKNFLKVFKKYLKSSLISKIVIENLLSKKNFDHILLNHGIYVPHGVILDVARQRGHPTSTWCPSYRKKSFCFSSGDTYHRSLIYENNENWQNIILTEEIEKKIDTYLKSREEGTQDWIHFYKKKPNFNTLEYLSKIGIDNKKPLIGLATSVLWDAQIDFPSNFYKDQLEWIFDTIQFFSSKKNLQLIIRISPAELNFGKPSRQKVYDEIIKKFPNLSNNIFIIQPNDEISSYKVFENCEHVLIYGSRIGIEMAARGKSVVVCGEGFIRNKGIATDIKSKEHYFEILKKISSNNLFYELDIKRAKKYAYHFFFRRTQQLQSLDEQKNSWPNFTISKNFEKYLKSKSDIELENILDSIIKNKDFIFEDEKFIF